MVRITSAARSWLGHQVVIVTTWSRRLADAIVSVSLCRDSDDRSHVLMPREIILNHLRHSSDISFALLSNSDFDKALMRSSFREQGSYRSNSNRFKSSVEGFRATETLPNTRVPCLRKFGTAFPVAVRIALIFSFNGRNTTSFDVT